MAKAPQINEKKVSEVRNAAVSFSGLLDSGEVLTGTPTVLVTDPTESPETLTLSDKVVNTAAIVVNGVTTAIGNAVQFSVSGGTANTEYTIQLSCDTDATPTQTLIGDIVLKVVAD